MSQHDQLQQEDAPHFAPREIGKRLAIARELLEIPLEKMARVLCTSTAKITQVEQGKLLIPDSWLPTLAVDFEIDTHWLATGARPVAAKTAKALDQMEKLMQVPEVKEFIDFQFKTLKLIFKDPIKKPMIPRRNK